MPWILPWSLSETATASSRTQSTRRPCRQCCTWASPSARPRALRLPCRRPSQSPSPALRSRCRRAVARTAGCRSWQRMTHHFCRTGLLSHRLRGRSLPTQTLAGLGARPTLQSSCCRPSFSPRDPKEQTASECHRCLPPVMTSCSSTCSRRSNRFQHAPACPLRRRRLRRSRRRACILVRGRGERALSESSRCRPLMKPCCIGRDQGSDLLLRAPTCKLATPAPHGSCRKPSLPLDRRGRTASGSCRCRPLMPSSTACNRRSGRFRCVRLTLLPCGQRRQSPPRRSRSGRAAPESQRCPLTTPC
mmetsp:Transcript_22625/g.45781  ORF Transcript_22625/g.45781 Transcript_22625/m.45781 type:complete len:304 (+) Transcript_22625:110-1021(+)